MYGNNIYDVQHEYPTFIFPGHKWVNCNIIGQWFLKWAVRASKGVLKS